MITIYSYGCTTCGHTGLLIKKAERCCLINNLPFEIKNTKYDDASRSEHAKLQHAIGIDMTSYVPIVYDDVNLEIKTLKEFVK